MGQRPRESHCLVTAHEGSYAQWRDTRQHYKCQSHPHTPTRVDCQTTNDKNQTVSTARPHTKAGRTWQAMKQQLTWTSWSCGTARSPGSSPSWPGAPCCHVSESKHTTTCVNNANTHTSQQSKQKHKCLNTANTQVSTTQIHTHTSKMQTHTPQ